MIIYDNKSLAFCRLQMKADRLIKRHKEKKHQEYVNRQFGNPSTVGRVETKYNTDQSNSRVSNIPYDEYLWKQVPDASSLEVVNDLNEDYTHNTYTIQAAIDSLNQKGGGTVVIPEGSYRISSLELKSNITLFLPIGTELTGLECDQYAKHNYDAVIYAEHAEHISICGGGTINGNGESFTKEPEVCSPLYPLKSFNLYTRVMESRKRIRTPKNTKRPNVIKLSACNDVLVSNVRLKDSAEWTFVVENCLNVNISDLVIDNNFYIANSDGIDLNGSSGVDISHCFIVTGDDGIVLKSVCGAVKNVTVEDCTICSYANCFKIGTETPYDVSDIRLHHCSFFHPNAIMGGYSGIAIESADGSHIRNVVISDVDMDFISSPLLIWLGCRLKYSNNSVGSIENIEIRNITATNCEMPCGIAGCEYQGRKHYVKHVCIDGLRMNYYDSDESLCLRSRAFGESMSGYPEITRISHLYFHSHQTSKYWSLPCYAMYLSLAEDVIIKNFSAKPRSVNQLPQRAMINSKHIEVQ